MNKYKLEIKWALYFTAMMLLWMVGERIAGLHDVNIAQHATYTNFVAIPAILVYVLALLDKRKKDLGGRMNYKQGFIAGLWITLFVTILSPVTQLITSLVISPDYFKNVIEFAVSEGTMTREEAEDYFNLGSYLKQTVMFTPVMGIITTAIVAIFTRKS